MAFAEYKEKDYSKLRGLNGIPNDQVEVHLGLYSGYVKNTNLLNRKIWDLVQGGKTAEPEYAELKRRLGFEYNGMRLHEYYFDNLKVGGGGAPPDSVGSAFSSTWGSFDKWKEEFVANGKLRGVGWVIAYKDPVNGALSNHWITLHEEGNLAGFKPVVVMDVWEHAFMVYRRPAERAKYIDDFFSNVNWDEVAARLK